MIDVHREVVDNIYFLEEGNGGNLPDPKLQNWGTQI